MINHKNIVSSILGIGVDLVELQRFDKILQKHDSTFIKRIFTTNEITYCEKHASPLKHYAARFCAKEAVSKALGTGIGKNLGFLDIQITSQENKKPSIILLGKAKKHFSNPVFDVSLSHTDTLATAFVIAYENNSSE